MKKRHRINKAVGKAETARPLDTTRTWALVLVLSATFLAFSNTLWHGFAFDDQSQIVTNDFIQGQNLSTLAKVTKAFTTEVWFRQVVRFQDPNEKNEPKTPYYRPLFTIYLLMGWEMFKDSPTFWHILSILMHLVVAWLVFRLLEKITNDLRLATIATLLWAIHPLRTESVAWISGISDPLLAVFVLPSFYFYLLFRERRRYQHLIASLAFYALAAFAKEPALALVIFIIAYEILVPDKDRAHDSPLIAQDSSLTERIKAMLVLLIERVKSVLVPVSVFVLVTAFYFALRYNALGYVLNDSKKAVYTTGQVLMTIPIVLWKYIGLLFFPYNLTLFHVTPIVYSPLDIRFILPALGLLPLGYLLWRMRGSMLVRFALLWFFVHLIPVLNLGTFSQDFMVQERYTYIPSIGFSLLLAMGLLKLPVEKLQFFRSRRTAQIAAIVVLILLFGAKTFWQNRVWKDDLTLWNYGIEAAPDESLPYYVLGHKYVNYRRYDKVTEALEQYLKIDPYNLAVINNLASSYLELYLQTNERAHVDRAIALCEKGIKFTEAVPAFWDTIGRAYTFPTEVKNLDRAIYFFTRALALDPDNPGFNFHMGAACVQAGRNEAALKYLNFSREVEPANADTYLFIAYAHHNLSQFREAIDNYNEYLTRKPDAQDAAKIKQDMDKLRAELRNQSLQSANRPQSN